VLNNNEEWRRSQEKQLYGLESIYSKPAFTFLALPNQIYLREKIDYHKGQEFD